MPTLPSSLGTNSSFRLVSVLVRCSATAGSMVWGTQRSVHPIPPADPSPTRRWGSGRLAPAGQQAGRDRGDALSPAGEAEALRGLGGHLEAVLVQVERAGERLA